MVCGVVLCCEVFVLSVTLCVVLRCVVLCMRLQNHLFICTLFAFLRFKNSSFQAKRNSKKSDDKATQLRRDVAKCAAIYRRASSMAIVGGNSAADGSSSSSSSSSSSNGGGALSEDSATTEPKTRSGKKKSSSSSSRVVKAVADEYSDDGDGGNGGEIHNDNDGDDDKNHDRHVYGSGSDENDSCDGSDETEDESSDANSRKSRDPSHFRLKLYKINDLAADLCREHLKGICAIMNVSDVRSLAVRAREAMSALQILPDACVFVKKVVRLAATTTSSSSSGGGGGGGGEGRDSDDVEVATTMSSRSRSRSRSRSSDNLINNNNSNKANTKISPAVEMQSMVGLFETSWAALQSKVQQVQQLVEDYKVVTVLVESVAQLWETHAGTLQSLYSHASSLPSSLSQDGKSATAGARPPFNAHHAQEMAKEWEEQPILKCLPSVMRRLLEHVAHSMSETHVWDSLGPVLARHAMNPAPEDVFAFVVAHFQKLFEVKNVHGVIPKMSEVYCKLQKQFFLKIVVFVCVCVCVCVCVFKLCYR